MDGTALWVENLDGLQEGQGAGMPPLYFLPAWRMSSDMWCCCHDVILNPRPLKLWTRTRTLSFQRWGITNTVPTSIWINRISNVISAPVFNIPQPKDWTPLLMMDLVFPHWSRALEYVLFPIVVGVLGSHSFFPGSFSPTAAEGPTAKLTWVMSALKDLDLTLCEGPLLPGQRSQCLGPWRARCYG